MDAPKRRSNANSKNSLQSTGEKDETKGKVTWKRILRRFRVAMMIFVLGVVALFFLKPATKNNDHPNSKLSSGVLKDSSFESPTRIKSKSSVGRIHAKEIEKDSTTSRTHSSTLRFVTVVDSGSEVNPDGRRDRLLSIHDTWGPKARVIFVVNNVTEFPQAPVMRTSSNQQYPQLLPLPPGTADRSIAALEYTIRTILKDINPDFAFFTNCHTFVIPEHVCQFLKDKSPSEHLYAGHALKVDSGKIFHPASSGYILSRETMQGLVQQWDQNTLACRIEKSHPGFFISECLKKVFQVHAQDTTLHDGQQFHSFSLMRLIKGDVDDWYKQMSHQTFVGGIDCCSENTISFHYMEAAESRALFATRQAILGNVSMSNEDLKRFMVDTWPSSIGGYSRSLPDSEDTQLWPLVLTVVRKISSTTPQEEMDAC